MPRRPGGQMEGGEGKVGLRGGHPQHPAPRPTPNPRHVTEPALLDTQPDSLSKPRGV